MSDREDVPPPGWRGTVARTVGGFRRDQGTDVAAALTYYAVFAIAPSLLALVAMLGVFGDGERLVDRTLSVASDVGLPQEAIDTLAPILAGLSAREGAGLGLVVGLLVALWSASAYVNAVSRAMNRVHQVEEGRPLWKLRSVMLLVTLAVLLLVVAIVVALVLTGPVAEAVGAAVGLSDAAVTVWGVAKWPAVAVLAALAVTVLYRATPDVRRTRRGWLSWGAVVALAVWAAATAAFGVYLALFGGASYDRTYGALAGVVLFLLWLWLTNLALLLGAELDAELDRGQRPAGTDAGVGPAQPR